MLHFFLICIDLLYCTIYFVKAGQYDSIMKKEGQEAVATIIRKDNGKAQYDIEYEGVFYRSWIRLTKKNYRSTMVGERFPAIILPDKLKYYHEGITPPCFKLIFQRLPEEEQDIEIEQIRIQTMYGN